jgi:hypothetical protein
MSRFSEAKYFTGTTTTEKLISVAGKYGCQIIGVSMSMEFSDVDEL